MRVVVPLVAGMLRPETVAAVGADAELVELDPDDDGAYSRLLIGLWEAGEDVALVEQDVVPPGGWLAELAACPWGWCTIEPILRPGVAWFGCVRWRGAFMAEHPTAMATAMALTDDGDQPYTWQKVDTRFERHMARLHVACHFHGPRCNHLHDYSKEPCTFAAETVHDSPYGPRTVRVACNLRRGHREPHGDNRGRPIDV